MQEEITRLLPLRRGHFQLESGHHGDLWLDLELLCLHPEAVRRLAGELARRLAVHQVELICGPLVEGAFVALMAASELGLPFCYSERFSNAGPGTLYPFGYRIPPALRPTVRDKRVAIVNDVINAGSAVRGTVADLALCSAQPVVVGSLLVLGSWAADFVAREKLRLETLAALPNSIWAPSDCPLCAGGVALDDGF